MLMGLAQLLYTTVGTVRILNQNLAFQMAVSLLPTELPTDSCTRHPGTSILLEPRQQNLMTSVSAITPQISGPSGSLFAFSTYAASFIQYTKEGVRNELQPGSQCLTLLVEIHPVNNVQVLKGSGDYKF
ncbi:uncharacterized protein LOC117720491 isoform X2 [Arvicanthis niloticus]|uniref:uncharacterized protein LOC117720491 isoform X2 n=1 Tax=Arvicanthis niloticus TaxID=61156 RepID=UPI00402BDED5